LNFRFQILVLITLTGGVAKADFAEQCRAFISFFAPAKSAVEQSLSKREDLAWDRIRASVKQEVAEFRRLPKEQRREYLEKTSEEVTAYLHMVFKTDNLGFHYNLHGGARESYITTGGIVATRGDVTLQDLSHKVYFFQSQSVGLLKVLDTANPNVAFPRMRMGHVLILFDLNAPVIKRLEADGVIRNKQAIFYDVDVSSPMSMKGQDGADIGVPVEAFVLPPMVVFTDLANKSGVNRPSWEEQNLIMMRFLEQMARNAQMSQLN
jgi:hypothetical protein